MDVLIKHQMANSSGLFTDILHYGSMEGEKITYAS